MLKCNQRPARGGSIWTSSVFFGMFVCSADHLSSELGSPSHQKLDLDWVVEIDKKVLSIKNPRVKDDIRLDWEIAP